jgi:hypothetical protein
MHRQIAAGLLRRKLDVTGETNPLRTAALATDDLMRPADLPRRA